MPADVQAFQNLLNQSNSNGLIAGVLGESNGRANWAGRAKGKFSTSGPATDINAARQDAQRSLYRDLQEPPNPFGGGSAPYLPGAMLPTMQGMNIAGVLGESNGRANWAGRAKGKFSTSGPATDINAARQDAQRSLYRDLLEPPNPFGGGSAPYLPGAMLPGYPGAAGNIGSLA